eukprot:TRINITY_DN98044_c0_g1_i1.p1 TRINITY_DN98044_c0_g1~~TRINITY_DN98044_c0_g1_i1.p1  ORF type:complete len:398 (-),score=19.25 TRINITY_DN98044_c0_g1_i1:44-1159(-)
MPHHKYNPLHILATRTDGVLLPPDTEPYSDIVYRTTAENWQKLKDEKIVEREKKPYFYLYQERDETHTQTGLVILCHVSDYDSNIIKRNELTRTAKENDFVRVTEELRAHLSPVILTYPDADGCFHKLIMPTTSEQPLFDLTYDDARHTLWRVTPTEAVQNCLEGIPKLYVADGHHRTASSSVVARKYAASHPDHTGLEEYNWFPAVIFPSTELRILPYHRVLKQLPDSVLGFVAKLGVLGTVSPFTGECTDRVPPGKLRVCIGNQWWQIELKEEIGTSTMEVEQLQDNFLAPVLGVKDVRNDPRLVFVGGKISHLLHHMQEHPEESAVAFACPPFPVNVLMEVSDKGEILPPKSTWFTPKPFPGLFFHEF